MSVTISADVSSPRPGEPVVVSVAGATAATKYVVACARPGGTTTLTEVTTDGSGAATFKLAVGTEDRGTVTFSVRPAAEYNGTTTAAATGTLVVGP